MKGSKEKFLKCYEKMKKSLSKVLPEYDCFFRLEREPKIPQEKADGTGAKKQVPQLIHVSKVNLVDPEAGYGLFFAAQKTKHQTVDQREFIMISLKMEAKCGKVSGPML